MTKETLLAIDDLRVEFPAPRGATQAVRGISLTVEKGEVFGIVGESGCGKTVTGRAILGLVPAPGRITAGSIHFAGIDLRALPERQLAQIRGKRIAMIFQDPTAALNPLFTIGQQLTGIMRRHGTAERKERRKRAAALLAELGLPQPAELLDAYPHQLSGGMRQRAMIAMALAAEPELIIADEPTTALDVTIQAQILDLLRRLRDERGLTIVFITHDLGVVAELCDRVAVVYLGRIVEHGTTRQIFREPRHPYTRGLLSALPAPDAAGGALKVIPGAVRQLDAELKGCAFAPRCEHRMTRCDEAAPMLRRVEGGQKTACFLYEDEAQ